MNLPDLYTLLPRSQIFSTQTLYLVCAVADSIDQVWLSTLVPFSMIGIETV